MAKKAVKKAARKAVKKVVKKATKKAVKKTVKPAPLAAERMQAPETGVRVRMYRPGHGDCFLLAMPREDGGDPYYVMIDCGFKPGSQNFIHKRPIDDVVQHIYDSTGGHLDLVVLTHEHQDHLNGLWRKNDPYFERFNVDMAWVAWTEDPANELANQLRERHKDQLLGLLGARRQMALAFGEQDTSVQRLDALLSFELGDDTGALRFEELAAAATDLSRAGNKQGMKLIKDKAAANKGLYFLYPGDEIVPLKGTAGFRAYVMGPPEDADLISDEDPHGDESFPRDRGFSFTSAADPDETTASPFSRPYCIPLADALADSDPFFRDHYGVDGAGADFFPEEEAPDNAEWRRIDSDWLHSAESLALKLNTGINNTSVVLAIELPHTRKILLFVGDAQRGNWSSWSQLTWRDGSTSITSRDILRRTVLYKVGHHGSHNATMNGKPADEHANLSWMGLGVHADEFTAMVTAVNEWALKKNDPPWVHPLPSIKTALLEKAEGRVFQTDTNELVKPDSVSQAKWNKFLRRCTFDELYFDYVIEDE